MSTISVGGLFRFGIEQVFPFIALAILLAGVSCAEPSSQLMPQLSPYNISINGTLGTNYFQATLKVTASPDRNITDLSFAPGNLRLEDPLDPWAPNILIPSNSIRIDPPETKTIKKGQIQEYSISVQNIPRSGRYSGKIYLNYKEQPNATQENITVSLVAYQLNASPIILDFDNSFLGLGGTGTIPKKIVLKEDSGEAPTEVMDTLASRLNASLGDLVNNEDKSISISGVETFKQWDAIREGNSIILYANFTNPNKVPGKYAGILTISSGSSLWPLINIPVEMRVRLVPWWAAFFLILAGVFISYSINDWNKKGREINGIRNDVSRIRESLSGVVTKDCKEKIEQMLNDDVKDLLYDDNLKGARSKVDEAESNLKNCIISKKKLDEKAESTRHLIKKLDDEETKAKILLEDVGFKESTNPVLGYLSKLKSTINGFCNNLSDGYYSTVDEKKVDLNEGGITEKSPNERYTEWAQKIQDLTDLLDGLEMLRQDIKPYENERKATFDIFINRNIESFRKISNQDDLKSALKGIKDRINQIRNPITLSIIDELIRLKNEVNDSNLNPGQKGLLKKEIEKLINNDLAGYASTEIIESKLQKLRDSLNKLSEAISMSPQKTSPGYHPMVYFPDFESNFKIESYAHRYPSQENLQIIDIGNNISKTIMNIGNARDAQKERQKTRKIERVIIKNISENKSFERGQYTFWTVETVPDDNEIEYMFSVGNLATDWTKDKRFTWTPEKTDKKLNTIRVKARFENDSDSEKSAYLNFELKPPKPSLQESVNGFMTPDMEKRLYGLLIPFIALIVATLIGYGQTYIENPIFGAGNAITGGYLALFLWGFGIEASTAKVADLFKNFGGG